MLAHGHRFNEIFLIENFSLHEYKKAGCNRVSDMTIEYTLAVLCLCIVGNTCGSVFCSPI